MKRALKILTYIEWLLIYGLMAIGIRIILMFIQGSGGKIEITLKNLNFPLYMAFVLWVIHLIRGEIPWRVRKDLFDRSKQ